MNPAALSSPARYLIVDDEPRLAERLAQRLAVAWPEAACLGLWHDGLSASQAIDQLTPDVVFLDIRMPGLDGLLLAQSQLDKVQPPRIVFVTAYQEHALEAFGLAAVDYLCKPVSGSVLLASVRAALEAVAFVGAGSGQGDPAIVALDDQDVQWRVVPGQGDDTAQAVWPADDLAQVADRDGVGVGHDHSARMRVAAASTASAGHWPW